ncbi:hypothetical protein H3H37_25180 [Duganella sp. LX20W]|uniref:Uncharacterized protein n=1 Tax=Rugamonas brunnea TaxID=2758569 RepID=A0A7W2EXD8_9BURK|nr:hypothetical protein [Rugamonas brunnea]MBA5640356.1 hypothetical protein [Rugamonas brunnea]
MKRHSYRSTGYSIRFRRRSGNIPTSSTPRKDASDRIAIASLFVSVLALLVSFYFSRDGTLKQEQANQIQQQYSSAERNAKIAALVTELAAKTYSKIDFATKPNEVRAQVQKRSNDTLFVLNSLYLTTRGNSDWDGYILEASERPIASLKTYEEKIRCGLLADPFRKFIFDPRYQNVKECEVCTGSCGGE